MDTPRLDALTNHLAGHDDARRRDRARRPALHRWLMTAVAPLSRAAGTTNRPGSAAVLDVAAAFGATDAELVRLSRRTVARTVEDLRAQAPLAVRVQTLRIR